MTKYEKTAEKQGKEISNLREKLAEVENQRNEIFEDSEERFKKCVWTHKHKSPVKRYK